MMAFLGTVLVGLVVGLIARAIKPGDDKMGWIMTILLGVLGALAAGYIGRSLGYYSAGRGRRMDRLGHRCHRAAGDIRPGSP